MDSVKTCGIVLVDGWTDISDAIVHEVVTELAVVVLVYAII